MTKLKALSAEALAELLSLPPDKARRWREVAESLSEDEEPLLVQWFGDLESAPSLRRSSVRELMELSVEDVQQGQRTGEFYRRFPYFKRKRPTDPTTRLRYLRELLTGEVEFEARYPAAFEVLFQGFEASRSLPLPSFDVRIPKNNPRRSVLPAGWYQDLRMSQDSGDASSDMFFGRRTPGDKEADQNFVPLDLGYMRGVLLTVLTREEYAERIATEVHNEAIREELGAPAQAAVRITDLRLATAPELEDLASLKEGLKPLLDHLEKPITATKVLQWKWDLLWVDEDARGRRAEETERRITRVSFAAAALLLFLDFRMPELEGASSFRLATQISELAGIVRTLSKSLNANAKKLETLLAYRAQHRPSTPGQAFYDALVAYRMGAEPGNLASSLGMTPYRSSPSESGGADWGGTKDWQGRLAEKLARGAEIEEQKYPLATAVFANRHKPRIARKALIAYNTYDRETMLRPEEEYSPWPTVGERIRVSGSTDSGIEVIEAYVQLGSCQERGLSPFPARSDFDA
jgi:hypothetical protein